MKWKAEKLTKQEIVTISLVSRGETIGRDSIFDSLIKRGLLDIINDDVYITQRGVISLAHGMNSEVMK